VNLRGPLFAIALTREGARLASRLSALFPGTRAFAPSRFACGADGTEGFDEPVASLLARLWPTAGGFLLVMAAGIAVRAISPLLAGKEEDPAVVVLDAHGRFAVSLLSGHLGGANDLAREAAARLGGTAVITPATDSAGVPAVEVWAREARLAWEPKAGVTRVNAAWASGEPVGAFVDAALDPGRAAALEPYLDLLTADERAASSYPGALLALTHRVISGLRPALWLRPRCVCLGVGCRRAASPEEVEGGIREALRVAALSALAVSRVVSVTEKAGEPALFALAESLGVGFQTFDASELAAVAVPTPSSRVAAAVGTPSVAEAAALRASGAGELLLTKVKGGAWTLAAALESSWTAAGAAACSSL
jgi:cobalt-precorrin 5A hydrolase